MLCSRRWSGSLLKNRPPATYVQNRVSWQLELVVRESAVKMSRLCDRCWGEGDSKPQVFGFLLERLDLLV